MMKVALALVIVFMWYVIDLDYDASDYRSIERMAQWSPSCQKTILEDMTIASDGGPSMKNLDGLNCHEIHEMAMEIRAELNDEQLQLLMRRNSGEFFR